MVGLLGARGVRLLWLSMIAASLLSAATLMESILFRALMDGPARIVPAEQRIYACVALLLFFGSLAAADHAVTAAFQRIGRALESEAVLAW